MKTILINFILMLITSSAYTQTSTKNTFPEKIKVEGTYQIQVINTRDQPSIPSNINEIVIKNRKKEEVTYYKLGDNVRIKILPIDFINSTEFIPLQLIEHIQE